VFKLIPCTHCKLKHVLLIIHTYRQSHACVDDDFSIKGLNRYYHSKKTSWEESYSVME